MDSQFKSDRVVRDFHPRHGLGATRGSIGVEGGHVRREHESLTCGDSTGEGVAAAGGLGGGAGWGRGVVAISALVPVLFITTKLSLLISISNAK